MRVQWSVYCVHNISYTSDRRRSSHDRNLSCTSAVITIIICTALAEQTTAVRYLSDDRTDHTCPCLWSCSYTDASVYRRRLTRARPLLLSSRLSDDYRLCERLDLGLVRYPSRALPFYLLRAFSRSPAHASTAEPNYFSDVYTIDLKKIVFLVLYVSSN